MLRERADEEDDGASGRAGGARDSAAIRRAFSMVVGIFSHIKQGKATESLNESKNACLSWFIVLELGSSYVSFFDRGQFFSQILASSGTEFSDASSTVSRFSSDSSLNIHSPSNA